MLIKNCQYSESSILVQCNLCLKLSLRDLAEMLLERGLEFTHEAVRDWEARFAPLLTDVLRRERQGAIGPSWDVGQFARPIHNIPPPRKRD